MGHLGPGLGDVLLEIFRVGRQLPHLGGQPRGVACTGAERLGKARGAVHRPARRDRRRAALGPQVRPVLSRAQSLLKAAPSGRGGLAAARRLLLHQENRGPRDGSCRFMRIRVGLGLGLDLLGGFSDRQEPGSNQAPAPGARAPPPGASCGLPAAGSSGLLPLGVSARPGGLLQEVPRVERRLEPAGAHAGVRADPEPHAEPRVRP